MRPLWTLLFFALTFPVISQNVGINTNSPDSPLHIKGEGTVLKLETDSNYIQTFQSLQMEFWGNNGTQQEWIGSIGDPGSSPLFSVQGRHGVLLLGGFGTSQLFMHPTTPGVVIGGSYTPQASLDVIGDIKGTQLKIGLTSSDYGLHVHQDSTVMFGQGFDAIGSKMFWDPSTSAFRAGYDNGNWYDGTLGFYSFGGGYGARASGYSSVALGHLSRATGQFTNAIGFQTKAETNNSTAIGHQSESLGAESFTFGAELKAKTRNEVVLGTLNDTSTQANPNYWSLDDPIFAVGNGYNDVRSNAITILKDGRTGINTSSPTLMLHVSDLDVSDGILLEGTSTTTQVDVRLDNNHSGGGHEYVLRSTGGGGGAGGGKFLIRDKTADINRLAIDSTGKVGVNTNTPAHQLHVEGDGFFRMDASSSPATALTLRNGTSGLGGAAQIEFMSGSATSGTMRVENSSSVDFDAKFVLSLVSNETVLDRFEVANNGTIWAHNDIRPTVDGGHLLGTPSYRWNTLYATNGTINTSDARDKQDIAVIEYGLDAVNQMRPVEFSWKSDPDSRKLGLIAQELATVIPEVVDIPENPEDRYGVYYSDLVPVLIKAVQELSKENADLKSALQDKDAQINGILARLDALEEGRLDEQAGVQND